ncbi:MAG: hypothetical protein QOJ16_1907, partial [Acidobacteriota bacterium]|nr:hypothetical protein [Acidobacteriota bacterium]
MAGGHDQLFKDLIQTFPGDFLRLAAPEIASRIDLGGLEFLPTESWTDLPRGARRQPDLLARVLALDDGMQPVLLHIEVELRYRSALPARLWRYNRVLSLRHDLTVHSMVLYLRGGPPGPGVGQHCERSLGAEISRFQYWSLGLSGASAAEYLSCPEPLAWAFAALMRWTAGDRYAHRQACLRRIAEASELNPAERFLLFNCVATYLEWDGRGQDEILSLLAERNLEEGKAMMTWAEKFEAKAQETGRQR